MYHGNVSCPIFEAYETNYLQNLYFLTWILHILGFSLH